MEMKLLILTAIKECQNIIADIFRETKIEVFSLSEIAGFREGAPASLIHSWFGSGGDSYDSIMLFSFTEKSKAENALRMVREYNQKQKSKFPIRGFILNVEQFGDQPE